MELLRTNFNNLSKYIRDLNINGFALSNLADTDISLSQMNYIDNICQISLSHEKEKEQMIILDFHKKKSDVLHCL